MIKSGNNKRKKQEMMQTMGDGAAESASGMLHHEGSLQLSLLNTTHILSNPVFDALDLVSAGGGPRAPSTTLQPLTL